jgi:predicted Zn-dependent peptidase
VYERLVRHAPIDLYIVGDVDGEEVRKVAADILGPLSAERKVEPLPPMMRARRVVVKDRRTVVDRMAVSQGKLAIGLRTGIGFGDPAFPALVVANGVLGGFSHSKLFQNVRERSSLAYYAYSRLEGTQGAAFLTAGIEFAHFEQAVHIIEEQVEAVKAGEIGEEEFDRTIRALRHHILVGEDSPNTRILTHLERSLYGMDASPEARIAELERVTPEKARDAAGGLTFDTVYFLTEVGVTDRSQAPQPPVPA